MKLNKYSKTGLIVVLVALMVEIYRDFPWLGKVFPCLRPPTDEIPPVNQP